MMLSRQLVGGMLAVIGVAVLGAGVALAQRGPSAFTTTFTQPMSQGANEHDDCRWTVIINPLSGNNLVDDPQFTHCDPDSWSAAYAEVWAEGEQIQGYAWAYDICLNTSITPGATKQTDHAGEFTLKKVPSAGECGAYITVDMKPRFKARIEVDAPASARAWGHMASRVDELSFVNVSVTGELEWESFDAVESDWSLTVMGTGLSLPTSTGVGGAYSERKFPTTNVLVTHGEMKTEATCKFDCSVEMDAVASSEGDWLDVAQAEAWVFESRPGIDLHGNCPPNCAGYRYIDYDWYP